jgi:hypothetical protein
LRQSRQDDHSAAGWCGGVKRDVCDVGDPCHLDVREATQDGT